MENIRGKEDRQEASRKSKKYIWRNDGDDENTRRYDQPVQDKERSKLEMLWGVHYYLIYI